MKEMRRKRQALSKEECIEVLKRGTSGVLSLCNHDLEPYGVPLSYFYDNNRLYFHSAKSGYKLDIIKDNPKASFCLIDQDQIVSEKYTTYFRSVIVFGNVHIIDDEEHKRQAIETLALKYSPSESEESRTQEIERFWKTLCMLELDIKDMTGKQAIELVQKG